MTHVVFFCILHSFLLEFLRRIGIKSDTVETLTEQCEKIIMMLTQSGELYSRCGGSVCCVVGSGAGAMRRSGTNIQYFIDFIQVRILCRVTCIFVK